MQTFLMMATALFLVTGSNYFLTAAISEWSRLRFFKKMEVFETHVMPWLAQYARAQTAVCENKDPGGH